MQANINLFLEIKTSLDAGNVSDAVAASARLSKLGGASIGKFKKRLDRLQKGLAAVDEAIAASDFDGARNELGKVCGIIGFGIEVALESTLARRYAQRIDQAESQVKPYNFGGGTCVFDYLRAEASQGEDEVGPGQSLDISLSFSQRGAAEETVILSGHTLDPIILGNFMHTGIGDIDQKIIRFLKEHRNITVFSIDDLMTDDSSTITLADIACIGMAQGPIKKAPLAIFLGDFREDPFALFVASVHMLNAAGRLSADEIISYVRDPDILDNAYRQELEAIKSRTNEEPSESIKCHYALVALQMQLHKDNPGWGESIEKFFSALGLARGLGTEIFQAQGVTLGIEVQAIDITDNREDSARRLSEEADRSLGGLLFMHAAECKMDAIRLLFKAHWSHLDHSRLEDAARCLTQVADLHRQLGSEELEAKTIGMAGGTLSYARDYAQAAEYADKAIQLGKKGDPTALATNYMTAGVSYMRLGDYAKALSRFMTACSLFSSKVTDHKSNGKALAMAAVCQKRLGRYREAGEYDRMSAEVNEHAADSAKDQGQRARWIAFAAEHYAYAAKNFKTAHQRASRQTERDQNQADYQENHAKTIALLRELSEPLLRRDDFKSIKHTELTQRTKELARYLMQSYRCLLDSITVPEIYEFAELLIRENATIVVDIEAINALMQAIATQA